MTRNSKPISNPKCFVKIPHNPITKPIFSWDKKPNPITKPIYCIGYCIQYMGSTKILSGPTVLSIEPVFCPLFWNLKVVFISGPVSNFVILSCTSSSSGCRRRVLEPSRKPRSKLHNFQLIFFMGNFTLTVISEWTPTLFA